MRFGFFYFSVFPHTDPPPHYIPARDTRKGRASEYGPQLSSTTADSMRNILAAAD